jgi:hypothetical protein
MQRAPEFDAYLLKPVTEESLAGMLRSMPAN